MWIDWLFVANLIVFLSIIAYEDLKTSLISDKYPLGMVSIAFLLYVYLCLTDSCTYLIHALIGGVLFLALGYALYYSGQWGEGDAIVLGAVIFSMPLLPIYPLHLHTYYYLWFVYFINLSLAGIVYSLLYTLYFSLKKGKLFWIRWGLQLKKGLKYLVFSEIIILIGYA
ncbi:MAG: hypothetical protein GXN99_03240, partial [Candidatus Nanohaloarchaeota archaeon]|nr:hypothetical protein [Candidatus Nanohaloarchaeota archaeon]